MINLPNPFSFQKYEGKVYRPRSIHYDFFQMFIILRAIICMHIHQCLSFIKSDMIDVIYPHIDPEKRWMGGGGAIISYI